MESNSNCTTEDWEEPLQHDILSPGFDEPTSTEELPTTEHEPPPDTHHELTPSSPADCQPIPRRSQRNRAPPDWYGTFVH